jgi:tRNA(Ile)-lysidine synthase
MAALGDEWPGAVAVSGGGDSVALMLLLATWARGRKEKPVVLTVDHGLRNSSAADAKRVVRWAKAAGLKAHALEWKGKKPKSDVEAAARDARYRLMGEWCRANGVPRLYVAHTLEDQAETFLMRLGRGSGLDGLSAMLWKAPLPVAGFEKVTLMRPLLGTSRAVLRDYLVARGHKWIEDPMNADPRFARTNIRALLPALDKAGIAPARIAAAAGHLARARQAFGEGTAAFLSTHCRFTEEGAVFDRRALSDLPRELGLRALAGMLSRVSGATYRPRFARLERLYEAVLAGTRGATLQGCRIAPAPRAAFGADSLAIVKERGRKGTGTLSGS